MTTHSPPTPLIVKLQAAHASLLDIHKALLDHERTGFEQQHGPIRSPGEFLQLVINDPWFAWLRQLSGLITQIDEFLSSREPPPEAAGEALFTQSQSMMLSADVHSEFQRHYQRALQDSPAVALAHGQWRLSVIQLNRKS